MKVKTALSIDDFDECIDSDISLADLVSLHHALKSAADAFSAPTDGENGAVNHTLNALLREENEQLEWRRRVLAREIRSVKARTRAEQFQKLRFELNECGDDVVAAEGALAEFMRETPDLTEIDALAHSARLRSIGEELSLAETAIRLISRREPKFNGLGLLIARAIRRLDLLDEEAFSFGAYRR